MKAIIFLLCLIFSIYQSAAGQDNTRNIESIRLAFSKINAEKNYSVVTLYDTQFTENVPKGGTKLTGFYKDGILHKIHLINGYPWGKSITEYYFDKGQLFFVLEKEDKFIINPATSVIDTTKTENSYEGRFYFVNDTLIKTQFSGKRNFSHNIISGSQKIDVYILETANNYIEKLTSAASQKARPKQNKTQKSQGNHENSPVNIELPKKNNNLNQEDTDSEVTYEAIALSEIENILENNLFLKVTSLTSVIIFHFNDSRFIFQVMALDGTELCQTSGPYYLHEAKDGSLAEISIVVDSPVRKSPLFADNTFDTEIFLFNNRKMTLNKINDQSLIYITLVDFIALEGESAYILQGNDIFFSSNKTN